MGVERGCKWKAPPLFCHVQLNFDRVQSHDVRLLRVFSIQFTRPFFITIAPSNTKVINSESRSAYSIPV